MSAPAKLASNRSPNWAFMQRFEIPNYDSEGNYLTRWRVVQTPWFGIYVHRFDGPDPRPTLHDHPWNFQSLVLVGGYVEATEYSDVRQPPLPMLSASGHDVLTRYAEMRMQARAHSTDGDSMEAHDEN